MKWLPLLLAPLLLLGCKNDQHKPETSAEDSAPRMTAKEHAKLIQEKLELEKDLGRIISNHDESNLDEIEEARSKLSDAYANLWKIRAAHPKLQAMNQKIADLNFILKTARKKENPTEVETALKELAILNENLEALAKEQPEITEAQRQIEQRTNDLNEIRRKLAVNIPEARHLIEALDIIDKKLIEASR